MKTLLIAVTGFICLTGAVLSQEQKPPVFDVAVIKPAAPDAGTPTACCAQIKLDPNGRGVSIGGITVRVLIQRAYDVFPSQVLNAPSWINSESYTIEAKAEAGAPLSREQFAPMLQRLLEDRFGLRLHREKREFTVLSLRVGRNGPKLKEAGSEALSFSTNRGDVRAVKVPMWMLATGLGHYLRRPVVDDTGLKENYDFTLAWAAGETEPPPPSGDSAAPSDTSGQSIFTALQEQIGLKLESAKEPLEVLVIDSVNRPSEN